MYLSITRTFFIIAVISICSTLPARGGWADIKNYILTNPGQLAQGLHEGGFSGLTHIPDDPASIIYAICDRGPNIEAMIHGKPRRIFPDPAFTPTIYKIELAGSQANILSRIKIRPPVGQINPIAKSEFITGLSNLKQTDEISYDASGEQGLPYDANGLDTEGIAYNPNDKTFWLCDEYSPSLIQVRADGHIITRLVPKGVSAKLGIDYVRDVLPALYARRQNNRGFEGVAVSPSGRYLFGALQSPLENPTRDASTASRLTRIIKLDLSTQLPVAEYIYPLEDGKAAGIKQNNVVISDICALGDDRLIVDERDNREGPAPRIKRLYLVNLARATNTLGVFDGQTSDGLTLEQHTPESLAKIGVSSLAKSLVLDMAAAGFPHEKIEGLCLLSSRKIAIVNDNDFSFRFSDKQIVEEHRPTEIAVYAFKKIPGVD